MKHRRKRPPVEVSFAPRKIVEDVFLNHGVVQLPLGVERPGDRFNGIVCSEDIIQERTAAQTAVSARGRLEIAELVKAHSELVDDDILLGVIERTPLRVQMVPFNPFHDDVSFATCRILKQGIDSWYQQRLGSRLSDEKRTFSFDQVDRQAECRNEVTADSHNATTALVVAEDVWRRLDLFYGRDPGRDRCRVRIVRQIDHQGHLCWLTDFQLVGDHA